LRLQRESSTVDVALVDGEGIFDEELDGFEDFDDGIGGIAIAANTGEALKFTLAISAKKSHNLR
jgi:hypothetical protein